MDTVADGESRFVRVSCVTAENVAMVQRSWRGRNSYLSAHQAIAVTGPDSSCVIVASDKVNF